MWVYGSDNHIPTYSRLGAPHRIENCRIWWVLPWKNVIFHSFLYVYKRVRRVKAVFATHDLGTVAIAPIRMMMNGGCGLWLFLHTVLILRRAHVFWWLMLLKRSNMVMEERMFGRQRAEFFQQEFNIKNGGAANYFFGYEWLPDLYFWLTCRDRASSNRGYSGI